MNIFISLGWDCGPATFAVNKKLRRKKNEGYMTCPFDLMITNYLGIIECFKDDFKYLYDPKYIELRTVHKDCKFLAFKKGDNAIVNTKYNFIFNHESPNHGQLHLHENWANGPEHFCMNNFEAFIDRYKNRVNNLRNYLNSGSRIVFINSKINNNLETCGELISVIKEKYPKLDFGFYFLDEDRCDIYNEYMSFFNVNL
jgi:hypothetical protein